MRRTKASTKVGGGAGATMPSFAANRDHLRTMERIAARFEGWKPARDVLVPVRGVPTVFPGVDAVTKVGGWPIERVGLVHGPSNHGKTAFVHGLGLSFLQRAHFYAYIDAEYTTPLPWLHSLMAGFEEHPGFVALRPTSYEDTVDRVREFCERIGEAKVKGELDPNTSGLVVVDSIRKLVPKRLLEALLKEGADGDGAKGPGGRKKKPGGIDGMGGRAAQYKAALNAQWLDELIPLVAQTGTAVVIITREMEDPDADVFTSKDWKVAGGRALIYESSLVCRVVKASNVLDGQGKDAILYGERHAVEIHKTKVGSKDDRVPVAHFHTSNGVLVPEGFDRARDVLELAVERGIADVKGSWVSWQGERLGQGMHAAVRTLAGDPERMHKLEAAVRETFQVAA